jgi:hypothetical protein
MSDCNAVYRSPPNFLTTLSAGDIAGVQRAYGRRAHGSVVTSHGDCLSGPTFSGGAEINDCSPTSIQRWKLGANGTLSTASSPWLSLSCLDSGGPTANGTNVADVRCSGSQTPWTFEQMYVVGWGGLCLDLQYGDTTDGNIVQLWHCGDWGGYNQRWTIPGDGTIRFGDASSTKCLTAGWNQADGFYIWDCVGTTDQNFTFLGDGSIQVQTDDTLCMDVQGWTDAQYLAGQGLPYSSEPVQSAPCVSIQVSQKWNLSGSIKDSQWDKCIHNPGSTNENYTLQQMWDCDGSEDEQWDLYLP